MLGVASFALYLASAPVTSDALLLGNDVVPYAVELASGDRAALFDAHHLLFHPLAALLAPLVSLGGRAGPVQAALLAQVLVSALGGALAVAAIARASGALAGARAAWVVGLLFATAIGNWLYASVGETYLPATAALAWLWGDALRARARGGSIGAVRLGALALLACLLRQDSVLALPWLVLVAPVRRVALGLSAAGASPLSSAIAQASK